MKCTWLFFFILCCQLLTAAPHPFDDLTSEEIEKTLKIIKSSGNFQGEIRFPVIKREEPSKEAWLSGAAKEARKAYVSVFDFKTAAFSELSVDLKAGKITKQKELSGLRPPVLLEETERMRQIVRKNEKWLAALKRHGIQSPEEVFIDVWAPGLMSGIENEKGRRVLRGLTYYKGNGRNVYSRPVEGIVVNVDLAKGEVISVWETPSSGKVKPPHELVSAPTQLKPLTIEQPTPSFSISGQEISWENWKIRYSMDPLQGLQIFHASYLSELILYKMSLAEMVVPYGDPEKNWSFRNAFDVGEYGLGKTLHPLEIGKDVPENSTLIDVVLPDDAGGKPTSLKGIAVYEKDTGILWKHRNSENGDSDGQRGRNLVLFFMTTIGNYDYGINYIFQQDGTIEVETLLTGILLSKGTSLEKNTCKEACLPLVEENILAPNHQHFFNFRIDLDIGKANKNSAIESNVRALPKGPKSPDGNVFISENTLLKTEKGAMRALNSASSRKWKIFSPDEKNSLGHPKGYALMAGLNAVPYLHPTNSIRKRAGFLDSPVWVTVYNDEEMSGAAPYPTTAPWGEGLPRYVSNNESLENKDLVLWYTLGVTHIPRPEEWPVMNAHRVGFNLMPVNYFSRNPVTRAKP